MVGNNEGNNYIGLRKLDYFKIFLMEDMFCSWFAHMAPYGLCGQNSNLKRSHSLQGSSLSLPSLLSFMANAINNQSIASGNILSQ